MRDPDEQPVGVHVVAKFIDRSAFTVREYAKAGKIPAHKPFDSNRWYFYMSEVRDAIGGTPAVFNQSPRARSRRQRAAA